MARKKRGNVTCLNSGLPRPLIKQVFHAEYNGKLKTCSWWVVPERTSGKLEFKNSFESLLCVYDDMLFCVVCLHRVCVFCLFKGNNTKKLGFERFFWKKCLFLQRERRKIACRTVNWRNLSWWMPWIASIQKPNYMSSRIWWLGILPRRPKKMCDKGTVKEDWYWRGCDNGVN